MKYLDGNFNSYVEVKDHRYRIHPTENIILRKRDPPTSLGLSIKFKMKLKLGTIRKLSKLIMIN